MSKKELGRDTVREVFGGALYQQGRGYYTALELFAILRGSYLLERMEEQRGDPPTDRVLPPPGTPARYLRYSHAFARRLMSGDLEVTNHEKIATPATEKTLRALLRGLELPIPGTRRPPKTWINRHFFPFPAELIHYDGVLRGRKVKVSTERYIFRGGGGLAHKILRTDPDALRLARTREKLRELVSDSGSAVGRIAEALHKLDESAHRPEAERPFEDHVEAASWTGDLGPETRWFELLREGVDRVLTRDDLTDFHRVEVLMHLVPLCLCMHQLAMARRHLGAPEDAPLVLDAGYSAGVVRERARRDLRLAVSSISDALEQAARDEGRIELLTGNQNWRTGPRTFFTTTLYAVGAVNAPTGRRYLCVRPSLLETLVAAFVEGQVSFAAFTRDILYRRLGFVLDYVAAQAAGLIDLDSSDLDSNGKHLATRLAGLGLLQEYSDATRMVGVSR